MSVADADETYAEPVASRQGLRAGGQLGRFTLRRVLGEGGMGVVWAAHDPDLDREIAIKLLRHVAAASPALRKRLLREARAMARLKHPNVITVYEVGSAGDTDFIAMELVEGATLDQWLDLDPPVDDVWRAILAAGRGLAAAHAAGLVHRDFKPHNVLRSRDGRVLVTDFGLARGLGEEPGAPDLSATGVPRAAAVALDETRDAASKPPSSQAGSKADSVLDSPLTQTGMLIGTPAYMAPEQFVGAEPDPRTDQFAFCVSAWQALTGARPFVGDTLEELRRSAGRGVDDVVADLAKPIRAVLARGLDPDPAGRWPDLDALLDALESARRPPRKVWPFAAATAVVGIAIVFAATKRDGATPPPSAACEPAGAVFAEAWSEQALADLAHASEGARDRIARAFEQHRARWTASYQEACNAPPSRHAQARLACLLGVRDETVAIRVMLESAPGPLLESADTHGMMPNLALCNGATPVAALVVPRDQPRRSQVMALFARTLALGTLPRDQLARAVEPLLADAQAVGWRPLLPIVEVSLGNTYLRHGEYDPARAYFRKAIANADIRFQAMAHVGLLEASIRELERPGTGEPAKPGALHEELAKQLTYARSAVRAAGNDPMLAGAVALLEAEAHANVDQATRYRQPYNAALASAAEARKEFEKAGDLRRAALVSVFEAQLLLARGDERALDDALFVVRSSQERVTAAGVERVPALDELRARIAMAKGEYREAHDRFDRVAQPPAPTGAARRGRVVDRTGNGVQANVVVWSGELHGDPLRAYTDPRFDGYVLETGADGAFAYGRGEAILAEAGGARSAPRAAGDDVTLVVEPTAAMHGTAAGARGPTVDAYARFAAGRASWYVHAAIGKGGEYRLEGLPKGKYVLGAIGAAGSGTRRTADATRVKWPSGRTVEVIVRAKDASDGRAWIIRGRAAPKTRDALEAIVAQASDVAYADLGPVGADATEAGCEMYAQGDRHAILTNNAEGEVTACIALADRVHCQTVTVDKTEGVSTVLFKTE